MLLQIKIFYTSLVIDYITIKLQKSSSGYIKLLIIVSKRIECA